MATDKRSIKQAAKTLRQELGRKHANRVGTKAIQAAAWEVASDPSRLDFVVQQLKVQPAPSNPVGKVVAVLFAVLFAVWMFYGTDDETTTRVAEASSTATQTKAGKKTVAQELAAERWVDATKAGYTSRCRKGRCKVDGYVLGTSKDKGTAFVTLGNVIGKPAKRYQVALRNAKQLGQFGPNYLVGGLICAPPKGARLHFRNCRIDPEHGAPWNVDAANREADASKANRREFDVVVEGYDGNTLIGYEDLPFLGKVTVALTIKNLKRAGRVPAGWTANVICFDEAQTLQTNMGTVRVREDCNQLGGKRP